MKKSEFIPEVDIDAMDIQQQLRAAVLGFPQTSGVYLMKDASDKIIYIGKAKNLRARVRSYFSGDNGDSVKTQFLVRHIRKIDFIVTPNEVEAFLLEAQLIKKHRPKYNVRLKDDKNYPYIRLSIEESYPQLSLVRKVKRDGAQYFGPYTSGSVAQGTIRLLNAIYCLRDCTNHQMQQRQRPCLTHEIGKCRAPCVGYISATDYKHDVEQALRFLRGFNEEVLSELRTQMWEAAKQEQFQLAARYRDSIYAVEALMAKQAVVVKDAEKNQDIINYYGDQRGKLVETMHVRKGRVIGNSIHFLAELAGQNSDETAKEWLSSFLNQYYLDNFIPDEILVPFELGDEMSKLLQAVLAARADIKVIIRCPTDKSQQELLDMVARNAANHFVDYMNKSQQKNDALLLIKQKLLLQELPKRIECYDVSHFHGEESVASQVVFIDGAPATDCYRRYKLRTATGGNDYAAMQEVLKRRFAHHEQPRPNLIVMDGGRGQLNIAVKVLVELDIRDVPIVGLAKARVRRSGFSAAKLTRTEERFFVPGRKNAITLIAGSPPYNILVSIRDEAHRFAISYHRKLRETKSLSSVLDGITGLGKARKTTLLTHFSSVEEITRSSVAELAVLPGFNKGVAAKIKAQLSDSAAQPGG